MTIWWTTILPWYTSRIENCLSLRVAIWKLESTSFAYQVIVISDGVRIVAIYLANSLTFTFSKQDEYSWEVLDVPTEEQVQRHNGPRRTKRRFLIWCYIIMKVVTSEVQQSTISSFTDYQDVIAHSVLWIMLPECLISEYNLPYSIMAVYFHIQLLRKRSHSRRANTEQLYTAQTTFFSS